MPESKIIKYLKEIRNTYNSKGFTWPKFLMLVGKTVFLAGITVLVAKLFGMDQVVLRTSAFDKNVFDAEYGIAFIFFIFAFPFYVTGVLFSWKRTAPFSKKFWPIVILLIFGGTYGLSLAAEQLDNYLLRDVAIEYAAARGELDEVKAYMNEHPYDTTATRLLINAVAGGELETSKFLIEQGGDPDIRVHWLGDSIDLIFLTINLGDPELLSLVIENGGDIFAKHHSTDQTLMHHVIEFPIRVDSNRLALIDTLLARGMPVGIRDNSGSTPLHSAADRMNYEVVEHLLYHGAKVNILDSSNYSPVFEVITSHNAEKGKEDEQKLRMLRMMIPHGVDMDGQTGRDYLYWAKKFEHQQLTAFIDSIINSNHSD
jgi:hypothetical protein